MAQGTDTQDRFEDRLRAWARYWMERRGIGPTALGQLIDKSQGYVSHWLKKERGSPKHVDGGCSAYMAYRLAKEFGIDPDKLFNSTTEPPAEFWRPYVPHARAGPRPPRQRGPAPRGPKSQAPRPGDGDLA